MINETIQLHPILPNINLIAIGQSQLIYNDFSGCTRPAIIICPGGGYLTLHEEEAEYVALKFVALGYMVFILNYSTSAPYAYFPAPMNDLNLAIDYVHENVSRYGIDQEAISVLGLSTGGHLVSLVKPNYKLKSKALVYPILDLSSLTNFSTTQEKSTIELMFSAIVGHAHPTLEQLRLWHSDAFIGAETPPTFLCYYSEDTYCTEASVKRYLEQLNKKRIPFKDLKVFSKKHGNPTIDPSNNWIMSYHNWLISETANGFDSKYP